MSLMTWHHDGSVARRSPATQSKPFRRPNGPAPASGSRTRGPGTATAATRSAGLGLAGGHLPRGAPVRHARVGRLAGSSVHRPVPDAQGRPGPARAGRRPGAPAGAAGEPDRRPGVSLAPLGLPRLEDVEAPTLG